jgi:hypothetical protein
MLREKLYNGNANINKEEFWIGKYFENVKKRVVWNLIEGGKCGFWDEKVVGDFLNS